MGNYNPVESKKRPSVTDTLRAAEEDHYLDCPNAEIRIRAAALLLDIILASLAISGIQNLCLAFQSHLMHLDIVSAELPASRWQGIRLFFALNATAIAAYLFISLRFAFLYFYFIWSTAFSGGSPGKLILGLRVVQIRTGGFPIITNALLRELVRFLGIGLGGIGLLYYFVGKEKNVFHDSLCETVVKRIHGRL